MGQAADQRASCGYSGDRGLKQLFDFGIGHPHGIVCLSGMATQTEHFWVPDNRICHGKKRSNQLGFAGLEESSLRKTLLH